VILYFFLDPAPRHVAPILTLNGSNNVFPPKDGSLGVTTMGDVIWENMSQICPKNSPKMGGYKQFQTKTPKSIHRNTPGTINPTNNRFEDHVQNKKGTSWVVRYYPKANTTWLTAAILKSI